MKQFILLILLAALSIPGFSQGISETNGNHSFFIQDAKERPVEAKIYPNPCKQEIITVELSEKEISEIRMTNIAGKEVQVRVFQIPENKKQIQLNDVANGIYLMKIQTSDRQTVVRKIIVAKE